MSLAAILACVDGSPYAGSVCDHAGWLAGRFGTSVTLLHVRDGDTSIPSPADEILAWARERLEAEGATDLRLQSRAGEFNQVALELAADSQLVVMGKRGEATGPTREALGSNVDQILRQAQRPVCLVSQVYLPISRALVLLDADPSHRRAVEFVTRHPALRQLELDLVLMDDAGVDYREKLNWARGMLGVHEARIFPLLADGPDAAAMSYLENHGCDLLIISREVLLADPKARFAKVAPESLWAWRAPVLVC